MDIDREKTEKKLNEEFREAEKQLREDLNYCDADLAPETQIYLGKQGLFHPWGIK